jgi:hypothetical protein
VTERMSESMSILTIMRQPGSSLLGVGQLKSIKRTGSLEFIRSTALHLPDHQCLGHSRTHAESDRTTRPRRTQFFPAGVALHGCPAEIHCSRFRTSRDVNDPRDSQRESM